MGQAGRNIPAVGFVGEQAKPCQDHRGCPQPWVGHSSSRLGGRRSLGDAPLAKTNKTKAAEMAEESMPATVRCSTSLRGHREGSRATLWCWAALTAAPHSPYRESRTSLHAPLFCPYFSFPGSTPLQTNLKPTPACWQGLCITHLQLTSDCPDLCNAALNCKAAAAAAPLRVSQGNALGVTATSLTSLTTS